MTSSGNFIKRSPVHNNLMRPNIDDCSPSAANASPYNSYCYNIQHSSPANYAPLRPNGHRDLSINVDSYQENVEFVEPRLYTHGRKASVNQTRSPTRDTDDAIDGHSPRRHFSSSPILTKPCNYANVEQRFNFVGPDYTHPVTVGDGRYGDQPPGICNSADCASGKYCIRPDCTAASCLDDNCYGNGCCVYSCRGNCVVGNYGRSNRSNDAAKKVNYYYKDIASRSYDDLQDTKDGGYLQHQPLSSWQHHSHQDLTSWQHKQMPYSHVSHKATNLHNIQTRDSKDLNSSSRLKNVSADVIREQEAMIEKLRCHLMCLEQKYGEHTSKLQKAVYDDGDAKQARIADLECQNKTLKSKMAEMSVSNTSVIDDMEIKLGAAEQEVLQFKAELHEKRKKWEDEKSELKAEAGITKIANKTSELHALEEKFASLKLEHSDTKEALARTERYLGDLKSAEESEKDRAVIADFREKTAMQNARIDELTQKLQYAKKILNERTNRMKELADSEALLNTKIVENERELERLRNVGDGALLRISEHNLSNMRAERDKLQQDVTKAKQVIEICKRNAHEAALKHTNVLSDLQERLLREEASMDGLRKEAGLKDESVKNLRRSLKEVCEERQNLVEENMTLKTRLSKLESHHNEETLLLQSQLVNEVTACYSDLQSLVNVCLQRAEGHEPNIASLLGMNSSSLAATDPTSSLESPLLKCKLDKIRDTRTQLDRLRSLVCNKFAEDLGDRLTCVLQ